MTLSSMRWQAEDPLAAWRMHATTFTSQALWRFRNDDGSETTATWVADTDTAISWQPYNSTSEVLRVRILVEETGGAATSGALTLQYNIDGAGWVTVDDASDVRFIADGQFAGTQTTAQLSGASGFSPGYVISSAADTPTISLPEFGFTEMEYRIFVGAIPHDSQVQFRVLLSGALLDNYASYPTADILLEPITEAPTIRYEDLTHLDVEIWWDDPVPNTVSYRVYIDGVHRWNVNNPDSLGATIPLDAPDTTYIFKVCGYNALGEGPFSNELTINAPPEPPPPPMPEFEFYSGFEFGGTTIQVGEAAAGEAPFTAVFEGADSTLPTYDDTTVFADGYSGRFLPGQGVAWDLTNDLDPAAIGTVQFSARFRHQFSGSDPDSIIATFANGEAIYDNTFLAGTFLTLAYSSTHSGWVLDDMTVPIPANAWFRVDAELAFDGDGSVVLETRLFLDPNGQTPDAVLSRSHSADNTKHLSVGAGLLVGTGTLPVHVDEVSISSSPIVSLNGEHGFRFGHASEVVMPWAARARHGLTLGHAAELSVEPPTFTLYPGTETLRDLGSDSASGVEAINDWSPEGTEDDTKFLCNAPGQTGYYDALFKGSSVPPLDLERQAFMIQARLRLRFRGTRPVDDTLAIGFQLGTPLLPTDDPTKWIATDEVFIDQSELSTEWTEVVLDLPFNNTNIPYFTQYRLREQIGLMIDWDYTTSGGQDADCFIDVSAVEVTFSYVPGIPQVALETLEGLATGVPTTRVTPRWALLSSDVEVIESRDAIGDRQVTWASPDSKRSGLAFEEIPFDRNGEFLLRFRNDDGTGDAFRFVLYGSGEAGNESGLLIELDTTEDVTGEGPRIELRRYRDGGISNLTYANKDVHELGRWYFMRVRVVDDIVSIKVWNTPNEPVNWDLEYDLLRLELYAEGAYEGMWNPSDWIGPGSFGFGAYRVDWLAGDVGPIPGSLDLHEIVDQVAVNPFVGRGNRAPENVVGAWAGNTDEQDLVYAGAFELYGGMANRIDVDTNARRAYVWETLRHSYNGEIYARFAIQSPGGDAVRLIGRGGGAAGSELGAMGEMRVSNSLLAVRAYLPTLTTLGDVPWTHVTSFVFQRMRFRVEGDSFKLKLWLDSDPEPDAWDVEASNADTLTPGWFGFGFFTNDYYAFDFVSFTTSQEASPPTALEPVGPYENYYVLRSGLTLGNKVEVAVISTPFTVDVRHGLTLGATAQGEVTAQAATTHGLTFGHGVTATSDSTPSVDVAAQARHGLTLGGGVQASVQNSAEARSGLLLGASTDVALTIEAGAAHGLAFGHDVTATSILDVAVRHGLTLGAGADVSQRVESGLRSGLTLGAAAEASLDLAADVRHGLVFGHEVSARVPPAGAEVRHGLTLGAATDVTISSTAEVAHGLVLGAAGEVAQRAVASVAHGLALGAKLDTQAQVVAEARSGITLGASATAVSVLPSEIRHGLRLGAESIVEQGVEVLASHGMVLGFSSEVAQGAASLIEHGLTLGAKAAARTQVAVEVRTGVVLGHAAEAIPSPPAGLTVRHGIVLGMQSQVVQVLSSELSGGLALGARAEAELEVQTGVRHGLTFGHKVDADRRQRTSVAHGLLLGTSTEAEVTLAVSASQGITLGARADALSGDPTALEAAHGLVLGSESEAVLTATTVTTTGLTLGASGQATVTATAIARGGLTLGVATTATVSLEAAAESFLRLGATLHAQAWAQGAVTHGLSLHASGAVRLVDLAEVRHGLRFGIRALASSDATFGVSVTHGLVLGHRLHAGRALRRVVELLISAGGMELGLAEVGIALDVGVDEVELLSAAGDALLASQGEEQVVQRSGGEIADVLVGADEIPLSVSGAGVGVALASSSYEVQVEVEQMALAVSTDENTLRSEMQEAI